MNQDAIKLIKEAIKHYEDKKLRLTGEILSLRIRIEEAEKAIFKVDNIRQSLEAGLEKLEEAREKEGKEEAEEIIIEKDLGTKEVEVVRENKKETKEEFQRKMKRGDAVLEAAETERENKNKSWELCSVCKVHHVAPWNKKKICSICQAKRKTTRPYKRKNTFI